MEIVIGVLIGIGFIIVVGLILVLFIQKCILKEYRERDEKTKQTINEVEKELEQLVSAYADFIVLLDEEKYFNLIINKDNLKLAQEFVALNRVIFEYKDKSYRYQEFREYRRIPVEFQILAKDIEKSVPTPNSSEEIALLLGGDLPFHSDDRILSYSIKQMGEYMDRLLKGIEDEKTSN